MSRKKIGVGLTALLFVLGATHVAVAKETTVSRATTTISEYRAGSAETAEIRAWIQAHPQYVNGSLVGDPAKLGDVRITYTSITAGVQASVGDGPPVSLPVNGNPGDVISISSVSGGASQTWTYTWVGSMVTGGWVLTSYSYVKQRPA